MPRIPEAELERLKREVSLVSLVEAAGVRLRRQGKDLVGRCPFHSPDDEPSFVVTPEKNLFRCFGCAAAGSPVDFVMRTEGVSFREAVVRLQQMVGPGPRASADAPELPALLEPWMDDRSIRQAVVDHYHATLLASPEPLAYLERRGLAASDLLSHFRVGFADRTLPGRIAPARATRPGQAFRRRLQELGLFREASGQEQMHGRVVVPIVDETGDVIELYGRMVSTKNGDQAPKHLYLPGPMRGVFNWQALVEHREVILCEALFDALTFWAAGFRHVTATYGASGPLDEHLSAFARLGTRRVLIAYDRDAAGDAGAARVAERLLAAGIECFRILFPHGLDANAYATKLRPADKSLELVIRQAQWMGKGRVPGTLVVVERATQEEGEEAAARDETAAKEEAASPGTTAAASSLAAASLPQEEAPTLGDLEARARAEIEIAATLARVDTAGPTPPAATPDPGVPRCEVPCEVRAGEVVIALGDRRYRVRGLERNLSFEILKVNLLVSRGERFFVDTVDLYSARQRLQYTKQAAIELALEEDVVRHDLGKVFLKLEELQAAAIHQALVPQAAPAAMTAAEQESAEELLRDSQLVSRLLEDFRRCGVVGEETNKLVGYLAAVSRKLEQPLAIVVQSSSAAGKTSLMDAILAFVPEEERVKYSAMTGQSLFYMSEKDLKHKVLALVEEEGAERASYALKLLQSEGELRIASTGKAPQSGRLVTHEYEVEGPVAIFLTTTAIEIDEELQNRCLVLTVDEDRVQTRAIHEQQRARRTLEGYLRRQEKAAILARHQNAQRLLRPLAVINPYAPRLTFLDTQTRTRRDHEKYLTLIEAIALLHQAQRPKKTIATPQGLQEYIEVTREDIALANRLAGEILGHSLDELAPQTRRLLAIVDRMVREACATLAIDRADFRFSRKDVREYSGWSDFQVKSHLWKLEALEYAAVHRGGRGQSFVYELVWSGEGEDGRRFLPGLIDERKLVSVAADLELRGEKLEHGNEGLEPRNERLEGGWSPPGVPEEPPRWSGEIAVRATRDGRLRVASGNGSEIAHLGAGLAARPRPSLAVDRRGR